MLKNLSDVTQPHKVTSSFTDPQAEGIPFGDPAARIPPIDELAKRGSDYSPELAYLMAVISAWSYSDEKVLAAKLGYFGFPGARIRRITVQNNALLVATTAYLIQSPSGEVAVLAFRGTDPANFIAVLTDTQVMQQPFFGARVHAGFHASVEVVWDDVHRALKAALAGKHLGADDLAEPLPSGLQTLYITGHSLGGAMAMLAAARLSRPDYAALLPKEKLKGVYTYGQPMVGDARFAADCTASFGDRLFRHVYNDDVVPHLPPRSSLEYLHAGSEYRSSALDMPWCRARRNTERADLGGALAGVLINAIEVRSSPRDLFRGLSIDDHMPPSYVEVSRYALNPARTVAVPNPPLLERAAALLQQARSALEGRLSSPAPQPSE